MRHSTQSKPVRWPWLCILALALSLWLLSFPRSSPEAAPVDPLPSRFTDRYDDAIKRSVKRWWPAGPHWHWWKAQLYQESLLNPDAVSPVGAEGIAQFMPGTWRDVSRQMGLAGITPRDATHAIDAGAYYMARLKRGWSSPRPAYDRHLLALASYNAGFGNILSAQKACGGKLLYAEIITCLPQITGHHSNETITYVQRIQRWRFEMELGR